MYKSREAKVKKQKETHSEIERKRRERMKRETEFLSTQLMDKAVRKDKLSIYKAGADQLLKYTEKLGKREFILNDSEYSAIIVNNFNGISLHIGCGDGEILWCHDNIKSVLGIDEIDVIGNTLYNICEPDFDTIKIIDDCLYVDSQEEIQLRNGELISRDIFVAMKVSDNFSKNNCYQGIDDSWYIFIELCGDISLNTDQNGECSRNAFEFKCLGRVMETVTPDHIESLSFIVKLVPENYNITSICGDEAIPELFCIQSSDMLGENMCNFIIEEERQYFKTSFNECISKQSLNLLIYLKLYDNMKMQFALSLNAVLVNKKVHFVTGKFVQYGPKMALLEDKSWLKIELIKKEECETTQPTQNSETRVTFDLEETELSPMANTNYVVEETSNQLSDCENLPSNDSFRSLIGDCNDFFYTDSIQDLVTEDINDIKCDDDIN